MSKAAFDKIAEGLQEALAVVKGEPEALVKNLAQKHGMTATIDGLQTALEKGRIAFDREGCIVHTIEAWDRALSDDEIAALARGEEVPQNPR